MHRYINKNGSHFSLPNGVYAGDFHHIAGCVQCQKYPQLCWVCRYPDCRKVNYACKQACTGARCQPDPTKHFDKVARKRTKFQVSDIKDRIPNDGFLRKNTLINYLGVCHELVQRGWRYKDRVIGRTSVYKGSIEKQLNRAKRMMHHDRLYYGMRHGSHEAHMPGLKRGYAHRSTNRSAQSCSYDRANFRDQKLPYSPAPLAPIPDAPGDFLTVQELREIAQTLRRKSSPKGLLKQIERLLEESCKGPVARSDWRYAIVQKALTDTR